jgi:hypothetical protein
MTSSILTPSRSSPPFSETARPWDAGGSSRRLAPLPLATLTYALKLGILATYPSDGRSGRQRGSGTARKASNRRIRAAESTTVREAGGFPFRLRPE